MAINDYETSRERGQPVELYKFVYGSNAGREYAYTNAEHDILFGGVTYAAIPLARDKIKTNGRADNKEIKIDVPLTSEVAELFRVFPPGRVITAIIRQGHFEDDDFPVVWTGRVLESRRHDNRATLTCESSESGMKRVGLRRHYQWPCSLALYGTRCGANKEAARTPTTAIPDGNKLILPVGWNGAFARGAFVGGIVEWESADGREFRTILRSDSDTSLTLNATPGGLVDGGAVDVYLGCPHTLTACGVLHNNSVNFGGQPFIPIHNPVGKNNHQ